ncbi:MAG: RluA family pseudouridine synthase [bacterium]|nr:RluA family pseudouridine synthase [bacterium]
MGAELVISADNDGRRVDRVLRTLWPQVPLGAIMKAVRTGEVRLDGKKTKADARLEEGQRLYVPWEEQAGAPEMRSAGGACVKKPPLETLYRDDYLWVVNKPAGLLTQPDVKGGDSLITRALAELGWSRSDYRPATAQRLDRNTTGAVIIALTGAAQRHLAELIRERQIRKLYHAVVEGVADESGRVDLPLLKDSAANTVRPDKDGQAALTLYRRLAAAGALSVVEAELVTGRPHQARVHLAAIGHPIVGDAKYGSGRGAKRPLLHARTIIFPADAGLPAALRGAAVTAPLPADMKKYEEMCDR